MTWHKSTWPSPGHSCYRESLHLTDNEAGRRDRDPGWERDNMHHGSRDTEVKDPWYAASPRKPHGDPEIPGRKEQDLPRIGSMLTRTECPVLTLLLFLL